MKTKLFSLLKSRRFYAALVALVVVVLQETLGLSEEAAMNIAAVLMAWIIGDSITKTE